MSASKFLSEEHGGGVHKVTDEVIEALLQKHPKPAHIQEGSFLFGPVANIPDNYFDKIDDQTIKNC